MKGLFILQAVITILLATGGDVRAAIISFNVTGSIQFVSDPDNHLGGGVAVSDPFTASFAYDAAAVDTSPGDPKRGTYTHLPPTGAAGLSFTVGGLTFQTDPNAQLNVNVDNNFFGVQDGFNINAGNSLASGIVPGFQSVSVRMLLNDDSGTAFSDDSLSTSFDVNDFNLAAIDVGGNYGPFFPSFSIRGSIGSITPAASAVPEPSIFALLASGSIGLLGYGSRRRRKSIV